MHIFRQKSPLKKLRKAWQYHTTYPIWRIYPGDARFLVGEERDSEGRQARFFCLDRLTGRRLWSGKKFVDDWWVGIDALSDGRLFLHGFAAPDMPLHKGITAIDLRSGEEIWNLADWCFSSISGRTIAAFRGAEGGGTHGMFDSATGQAVDRIGVTSEGDGTDGRGGLQFPEPVASETDLMSHSAAYIRKLGAVGPIERLGLSGIDVISFCIPGRKEKVCQLVSVIDQEDGREMLQERVAKDVHGFAPDAFFVQESILYMVSGKQSVIAVELSNRKEGNESG